MANKVLSIYVGNDAIRIAEMQKNSNGTVILSNAAEISTPDNSVNDGYLVDITAISEAIRQAVFGRGFTAKEVIFTVQSKKIASKDVELPYLKQEKKRNDIILANSGEYFPMSNANDYRFGHTVLEEFTSEDGKKMRASVVAAPDDLIKCYYDLADELKYTVKAVDYFGNSIIQLLTMQMSEGRVDMVLQIEKDATYVNVMRGKTLVLQRSVPYGKNAVINALMDVKKISEKDAKTLLSNETLLDQHVTADEYAQTVQYLVSGIGRVVEYHRTKNVNDVLQGIKIFGEGSAIAGIEKILERELGAPVQHFETLSGVTIKGQASLTAEQVLRYLPNIGAVINPLKLPAVNDSTGSRVSSENTIKILLVVLCLAVVASGTWFGITFYKFKKVSDEQTRLNQQIAAISDIEQIAQDYENAQAAYHVMRDFDKSTHSSNEYILQFLNDLEVKMPEDVFIDKVQCEEGAMEFEVMSEWHEVTKNEVADILVTLGNLEYVDSITIPDVKEEYKDAFVVGVDENGETEYLRKDPTPEQEALGIKPDLVEFKLGDKASEENQNLEVRTVIKSTYKVKVNFKAPENSYAKEEEEEANMGVAALSENTATDGAEVGGEQ